MTSPTSRLNGATFLYTNPANPKLMLFLKGMTLSTDVSMSMGTISSLDGPR